MNRERNIRGRIRAITGFFIIGLVLSGATAIPLTSEVDWLVKVTGAQQWVQAPGSIPVPGWAVWLTSVQAALRDADQRVPFIFYGADWLAFGHFVIAVAFIGALRDPVRNRWLFTFGMIACILVIPYAAIFGALRGIPVWWRIIDCSFGVFGIIPLWLCRNWVGELEALSLPAPVPRRGPAHLSTGTPPLPRHSNPRPMTDSSVNHCRRRRKESLTPSGLTPSATR